MSVLVLAQESEPVSVLALALELALESELVSVLALAQESELALVQESELVLVLALAQESEPVSDHHRYPDRPKAYPNRYWLTDRHPESTTELCNYGFYTLQTDHLYMQWLGSMSGNKLTVRESAQALEQVSGQESELALALE